MIDLGSLAQCLVDSDSDARGRARRLRSKAFVLSVVIECALVAALLLSPLIAPAALPRDALSTPVAPYYGGGKYDNPGDSRGSVHRGPARFEPHESRPIWQPHEVPRTPTNGNAEEEADFDCGLGGAAPSVPGAIDGGPAELRIPGGTGDRVIVPEPAHMPPRHSKSATLSEGVMAAMLVHRVDPVYPTIAKAAHISGVVHLHAIISRDGMIRELEVVDGSPLLAHAALAAVREWRYRPTLLSGEPVEVDTYITVKFVLN